MLKKTLWKIMLLFLNAKKLITDPRIQLQPDFNSDKYVNWFFNEVYALVSHLTYFRTEP